MTDPSVDVRIAAANAAGRIGDLQLAEALLAHMNDPDEQVRQAIDAVLARLESKASISLPDKHGIGALLDRISTARTVGKIIDTLDQELAKLAEEEKSIEYIDYTDGRDQARAALGARERKLTREAAQAIARIGTKTVEPLLCALKSRRAGARMALVELGSPVVSHLHRLMQEFSATDSNLSQDIVIALGEIADSSSVEPLVACLKRQSATIRVSAVDALGRIDHPLVVPTLISALVDESFEVRRIAADCLGEHSDPRVIEPLVRALCTPSPKTTYLDMVQDAAARSLVKVGKPLAVPFLVAALKNADGYVRRLAARCLGQIADPETVEPLLSCLLHDRELYVRSEAAKALHRFGGPQLASQSVVEELAKASAGEGALAQNAFQILYRVKFSALDALVRALEKESTSPYAQETLIKLAIRSSEFKRKSIETLGSALTRFGGNVRELIAQTIRLIEFRAGK